MTPVRGAPSAAAAEAQSAPPRLAMQATGAGAGQPAMPGVLNFGDLLSGTDSNVGSNDTTRSILPLCGAMFN